MYEAFFGMTHTPFIRGIPVSSLYTDAETDEIHDRLLYTAKEQLFAILAADAGMGKTTVLRRLRSSLSESEYTMLYLADSKMTPRSFYNELLEQLGCQRKFLRNDARRSLHHEIEIMRGIGQHKLVVAQSDSTRRNELILSSISPPFLDHVNFPSNNTKCSGAVFSLRSEIVLITFSYWPAFQPAPSFPHEHLALR
jgi:hypothetical protein